MIINKYFMKSVNRITKDFKQKELLPLKLVFFVQASTAISLLRGLVSSCQTFHQTSASDFFGVYELNERLAKRLTKRHQSSRSNSHGHGEVSVKDSAISVLYPYLTIHMRELGINVEEAAIMSAVIPVIGIIMPPLAGMVADKIGNFKLLLAFFSFIGGAAALLLLLVPVGRATITHPPRVLLDFGCGGLQDENSEINDGFFKLGFSTETPCDPTPALNSSELTEFSLDTNLEACGFVCRSDDSKTAVKDNSSETPDVILKGRSYSIQIVTNTTTGLYNYNLTKDDVPKKMTKEDILSSRLMPNEGHLKTSIRRVAPSEYFFPTPDLSQLTCKKVPKSPDEGSGTKYVCFIAFAGEETGDVLHGFNKSLKFSLRKLITSDELNQYRSDFMDWMNQTDSERVTCGNSNLEGKNISATVHLHNPENNLEVIDKLSLSQCEPRCLVSAVRKSMCTNLKKEETYDPQLTFWIYLVIRVFIGIIGSTSYAMYEVAVIAILREQKADYGLQRIYASIGGMIASPLSGLLIDYASQGKGYTDFKPAFYLYAGLKMGTSILMLFINLEFKQAATNVISDAIEVLKNLEIIALLVVCFVLGSAWGYIESFLFWFLEDLGGTRSLMGITITVGGIAGIPLLVLSGPIIDKIGHANVLFIGFVFYAIRLVGYSIIYNPYHCLYFEAMESITSSLAITAAITYAARLSTTTTDGSVQGLVGGLYFGVGRGAGSLIGGYLMEAVGTRPTYRIFAAFSLIVGIIYYFFNHFCIRRRPQKEGNDICKKEPKPIKGSESEVKIITEKPKSGNKEYGTMQLENNNQKMGVENEGFVGEKEEEKKKEENPQEDNKEEETKKKE